MSTQSKPRLRMPRVVLPRVSVSRVRLPGASGFIATVMFARSSLPARPNAGVPHWGLALVSLVAIVLAVGLPVLESRQPPDVVGPPPRIDRAATTAATTWTATQEPLTQEPVARLAPAATRRTAPVVHRPERIVHRPAQIDRVDRDETPWWGRRTSVASSSRPPLRLSESYVQPRVVASRDGARVRGKVILGVLVRSNGRVGEVDVMSGDADPNLERAAIAAVKQWRYRPALRDGVPTPARVRVVVKFG